MVEVRRGWAIGVIAVAAIVAAGWITLVKIQTLDAAAGWVSHSQDVRLALERALSTLKDTETSTRGFIVTHAPIFEFFDAAYRASAPPMQKPTTPSFALVVES